MVANVRGYTPNYNFKLINFDTPRWHTLEYSNWAMIDTLFLQIGTPPIRGEWQNSVDYLSGDRVFDPQSSDFYRCIIAHTSAPTGLFSEDRLARPTLWVLQTLGVPLYRGEWMPSASYTLGDIVVVDDFTYYLCIAAHVASLTFPPDAANWVIVFDIADATHTATQAATDAATSAGEAADSAAAAATSETNAATSETNAANSATAAATSETNAATSATNAATSASDANFSAIEAGLQSDSLHGTSNTPNLLSIGTKTFVTQINKQFDAGVYMTIVDIANSTNILAGQVVSYVGDTLVINVLKAQGGGSPTNWDLYVSGAVGSDGASGSATVVISNFPPATADNSLWWETDSGLLYVKYNDGNSSQWVIACPQPDTAGFASGSDLALKVAKTGDIMSGDLSISKASPTFIMNKASAGQYSNIRGQKAGLDRWVVALGDGGPESGGNLGSNFTVYSYDDSGSIKDTPFYIERISGLAYIKGDPTSALGVATKQYVDGKTPVIPPPFPAGTAMLFHQTSAPTGWVKRTNLDDYALRVVSGNVGSGGVNAFSSVFAQTTTGGTALTAAQQANMGVSVSVSVSVSGGISGNAMYWGHNVGPGGHIFLGSQQASEIYFPISGSFSGSGSGSGSGNTTNGGGQAHTHPITMNVRYLDIIIADKS